MADIHYFSKLGWAIIELKIAYYHPNLVHDSWKSIVMQPDSVYDRIEDEYKKIAEVLGRKPTACEMVGVDFDRPSVRLVNALIGQPKGGNKCSVEGLIGVKGKK